MYYDIATEVRSDVAYEASNGFGGFVPFQGGAIREAFEGSKYAGIIRRFRDEIASRLQLCFADRLDYGQQRVARSMPCMRARE